MSAFLQKCLRMCAKNTNFASLMKRYLLLFASLLSLSIWAETRDGYTVNLVHTTRSEAYLLVPEQTALRHPAVVLMHDHGGHFVIGKEKMVRPMEGSPEWVKKDAQEWVDKLYAGMYLGDSLARAGYVVIVPDAYGWGSRMQLNQEADSMLQIVADDGKVMRKLNKYIGSQQENVYRRSMEETGLSTFEQMMADDRAALDYLWSLPCVDTTQIACFGFSMGACRSWALAAADQRIKACAFSNWMTTRESLWDNNITQLTGPSSYTMRVDGAFGDKDYPEVAAMVAPRPMLMMYGVMDNLFTIEGMTEAVRRIEAAYTDGDFTAESFDVKHQITEAQWRTLLQWLNLKNSTCCYLPK